MTLFQRDKPKLKKIKIKIKNKRNRKEFNWKGMLKFERLDWNFLFRKIFCVFPLLSEYYNIRKGDFEKTKKRFVIYCLIFKIQCCINSLR